MDRTCIVTKKIFELDQMIRFVCDEEGQIYPDMKRKLPGRGAWVQAQRSIIEKAILSKAFTKNFKRQIFVDKSLLDLIENLFIKNALGALAMARKAGAVITGKTKIENVALKPNLFMLLHSQEAAIDGKRKLAQAIKSRESLGLSAVSTYTLFNNEDLASVFKDQYATHIALLSHSVSNHFLQQVKKLLFYRGDIIKIYLQL